MAKALQAEALALEALTAFAADALPRALYGSARAPGVLKGASAAVKAAGQLCLERGWLEPTGTCTGAGKTRKEQYRLTPAGLHAVLSRDDPTALLGSLAERLEQLGTRTAELSNHAAALQADCRKATQDIGQTLVPALERLKPPDLEQLRRLLAPPPPAADGPRPLADPWLDEVIRLAAEQKQRNPFQRLTLPQIYERLRGKWPTLTLGEFHDGLRRLQDERRIRLGAFTQALATLDEPRNALFLDREVKYYVEPA